MARETLLDELAAAVDGARLMAHNREFARRIKKDGLSVRATEQGVQDRIRSQDGDQLRIVDADGNALR